MECKAPDGRYLVTRKVHWQAVYRVLVDEGWYDASLGYAGFVDYIRSVAPPGGFRIMPDVETIRHISQTLYARPFRDWRYDAAYGTKRWSYERMRAVADALMTFFSQKAFSNFDFKNKAVGEFNYQHANMLISVGYFNVFRNFAE